MKLTVIIVCKNGEEKLNEVFNSVHNLGDEILFYDSGSCDKSTEIAKKYGARIVEGPWEGYGKTRYRATQMARYDWILMLDTDEVLDHELKQSILALDLTKINIAYNIPYKNFFGNKYIRFGEWGNDSHVRLANRRGIKTDEEVVHEKLFLQPGIVVSTLKGNILHYTVKDAPHYALKQMNYAWLCAEKYIRQGKRATILHLFLSPPYTFFKNYIIKLGFLDGWQGFVCAKMSAWYTFLKYARLKELQKALPSKQNVFQPFLPNFIVEQNPS
ncbi:MAG TPA: glycosyltransferase family 2 protein [Ferruginibacter sp.]|nr:glycosyltransferase family 2 protein [Ferruginibacter sp.]